MNNRPIGIFDSGIGGLTVLQNLIAVIPDERYIYVGDNKHCPYGDKTCEQLYDYACTIIDYFISENTKLIVVACNTISSNVLPELIKKYKDIKIIGVIGSTTKLLINYHPKNVLVIATKATIESHAYKKEIEAADSTINVGELATPLLVPLIEAGSSAEIKNEIHNYLNSTNMNFDSIVLGCTHYAIIEEIIRKIVGTKKIVSSSEGVTQDVKAYLIKSNLKGNEKKIQIYTTGNVENFVSSSIGFFDYNDIKVEKLGLF